MPLRFWNRSSVLLSRTLKNEAFKLFIQMHYKVFENYFVFEEHLYSRKWFSRNTRGNECSLCYYFNQILGLIKSVIGKLGHRCHALTLLETVQVCFYHEHSRMKLLRRFIQLHYKVFENDFIGTFTPENDSDGIPEEIRARSIKHVTM